MYTRGTIYYARSCAMRGVLVRVSLVLLRPCGGQIGILFTVMSTFLGQTKCYTLLYTFPWHSGHEHAYCDAYTTTQSIVYCISDVAKLLHFEHPAAYMKYNTGATCIKHHNCLKPGDIKIEIKIEIAAFRQDCWADQDCFFSGNLFHELMGTFKN